jgi:hypothetical protein
MWQSKVVLSVCRISIKLRPKPYHLSSTLFPSSYACRLLNAHLRSLPVMHVHRPRGQGSGRCPECSDVYVSGTKPQHLKWSRRLGPSTPEALCNPYAEASSFFMRRSSSASLLTPLRHLRRIIYIAPAVSGNRQLMLHLFSSRLLHRE